MPPSASAWSCFDECAPHQPDCYTVKEYCHRTAQLCSNLLEIAQLQVEASNKPNLVPLTSIQKAHLFPYFGNLVDRVKIGYNAILAGEGSINGNKITWGYSAQTFNTNIYMRDRMREGSIDQLVLIGHEMKHVEQFRWSNDWKRDYCLRAIDADFSYQDNNWEEEARSFDRKLSTCLLDQNECKLRKVSSRYDAAVWNPIEGPLGLKLNTAIFFSGSSFWQYDYADENVEDSGQIGINRWLGGPSIVDTALLHPKNNKIYLFSGPLYYRYGIQTFVSPFGRRLEKTGRIGIDGWFKVPQKSDASIVHPNGHAYFFKGSLYYRYDFASNKVEKTGVIGIDGWYGLHPAMDAALNHPNGKAYFFYGRKYVRWNFDKDKIDKTGFLSSDGWRGL